MALRQKAHARKREKYLDVCLIDALRGHGHKCEYAADGPFWAMRDGNRFVNPLGKIIRRTDWQHIVRSRDAKFLVAADAHFMALRKQDGCLQLNHTNRTHNWEAVQVDDIENPVSYSAEHGWFLNPRLCTGFFAIEDAAVGGTSGGDVLGGAWQDLPNHVDVVTILGDLTSLARFDQTSTAAHRLVTDSVTWTGSSPGLINSQAVRGDWFRGGSELSRALRSSRFLTVEWPSARRTMLLAETSMTIWRTAGSVLGPLRFNLCAADMPERCIISVGSNMERCWCELGNLQGEVVLCSMSHSRRDREAATRTCRMPWRPMESDRQLHVQWGQCTFQICMDGYLLGCLPLEHGQFTHAAQVAIHIFCTRESRLVTVPILGV
ncbi:unnamed protein product [Symbiodinium sp. CCMP2592]|nr:unnamed protein product [Symbiodinium sp. CCMP2592]